MTNSTNCTGIHSNSDIAGIGVRTNFYATILLIALTPDNEHTAELQNRLYENSVFYSLALILTAIIQTIQHKLDLYHAMFVMQIVFTLSFVYSFGMRRFVRGPDGNSTESRIKFRRTQIVAVIQLFAIFVFTIWLLYVWAKDSHFGSQPECNNLVKFVFFFVNIRATATWLRVGFIIYLGLSSGVRCILIILFFMDDSPGRQNMRNRLGNGYNRLSDVYERIIVGCYALYGVVMLELFVKRNRRNIEPGEEDWSFAQIIALILVLGCLVDIVVTIFEWYQRSRNTVAPARDPEMVPEGEDEAGGEEEAGGEREADGELEGAGRDVLLRPRRHGVREADASNDGESGGEKVPGIEEAARTRGESGNVEGLIQIEAKGEGESGGEEGPIQVEARGEGEVE